MLAVFVTFSAQGTPPLFPSCSLDAFDSCPSLIGMTEDGAGLYLLFYARWNESNRMAVCLQKLWFLHAGHAPL